MAKLGVPHIVISIPRLITVLMIAGAAICSTQLLPSPPQRQQIQHTQTVSVKNTVPYTAAPQTVSQPAPVQAPKTVASVPQIISPVNVTHSTNSTPVVTPSPSASVSGLSPVNPTSTSSSSGGTTGTGGAGTGSGSGGSSSSSPTTSSYTSENWSGYMTTTGKYSSVSGSWTVPKVTGASGETTADATWIGIGGVTTGDLIQVGTQDTVKASSTQTATAFYELLPHSSRTITSLTIAPGDVMDASLDQVTTGRWKITISDASTGKSYTSTVAYDSLLSSAEWIEEDPSYSAGHLVPLDSFSPIRFTGVSAIDNGDTVNLSSGNANPITLATASSSTVVATPSSVGSDDESFTITKQS